MEQRIIGVINQSFPRKAAFWLLPEMLDVRHERRSKDYVDRVVGKHLVSNMDVAALGVTGVRLNGQSPEPAEISQIISSKL